MSTGKFSELQTGKVLMRGWLAVHMSKDVFESSNQEVTMSWPTMERSRVQQSRGLVFSTCRYAISTKRQILSIKTFPGIIECVVDFSGCLWPKEIIDKVLATMAKMLAKMHKIREGLQSKKYIWKYKFLKSEIFKIAAEWWWRGLGGCPRGRGFATPWFAGLRFGNNYLVFLNPGF